MINHLSKEYKYEHLTLTLWHIVDTNYIKVLSNLIVVFQLEKTIYGLR
jgi:hypothetical protein